MSVDFFGPPSVYSHDQLEAPTTREGWIELEMIYERFLEAPRRTYVWGRSAEPCEEKVDD